MVKNEIRKRSMEAQGITPPPQGPPGPVPGHVRPGGPHGFRPGVPGGHGPPGGPPPMHMQHHIRMQQGKLFKIGVMSEMYLLVLTDESYYESYLMNHPWCFYIFDSMKTLNYFSPHEFSSSFRESIPSRTSWTPSWTSSKSTTRNDPPPNASPSSYAKDRSLSRDHDPRRREVFFECILIVRV